MDSRLTALLLLALLLIGCAATMHVDSSMTIPEDAWGDEDDVVWNVGTNPTGSVQPTEFLPCDKVFGAFVDLEWMLVLRTPNDSGSREEWNQKIRLRGKNVDGKPYHFKHKQNIRPPDNLTHQVRFDLETGRQWFRGAESLWSITGHEDDGPWWKDDPIPELSVRVINPCLTTPPRAAEVPRREQRFHCKYDTSGNRAACWSLYWNAIVPREADVSRLPAGMAQ